MERSVRPNISTEIELVCTTSTLFTEILNPRLKAKFNTENSIHYDQHFSVLSPKSKVAKLKPQYIYRVRGKLTRCGTRRTMPLYVAIPCTEIILVIIKVYPYPCSNGKNDLIISYLKPH